jgi:hypothetical protein
MPYDPGYISEGKVLKQPPNMREWWHGTFTKMPTMSEYQELGRKAWQKEMFSLPI